MAKPQIVITAKDRTAAAFDSASRRMRNLDDNTLRLRQSLVGLAAAYGGLRIIGEALRVQAQFQQSISDLSAITGATGKQLAYLTDQAREMGKTTVYSASQAANAFTLIASAKPDLLNDAEALSKVTHESLILAEASGSTLPAAASALGQALNQFDAGAEQSTRFINALAAGQKYGASMIDATSQALVKFGVVAHNIGHLSFEDTVAAIEAVAKGGEFASEAGTHLRSVLINLETQSNNQFKPSVVGLVEAFKNLSAAELSSSEEKVLFGKRNIAAGEILMKHTEILQGLIDKITGTNVAYDQASIRTDNLIGDTKALTSAYQDQQIAIGKYLNPAERVLVESLTMVIRGQKDAKEKTDATRESSLQLAIDMGVLADAAVNAAHGIALPFQMIGGYIGHAAAQVDALIHGNVKQFMEIGAAWRADMAKRLNDITDPSKIHTFENNARQLVARLREVDKSAPKPLDLSIPSLLPTIDDLVKFYAAQQRAANVSHTLSKAQLAESNVMKQLQGQFEQQQQARLRSETVMSASQRALADQFQKIEERKITAMQKALDLRSRETITDGEYRKMLASINAEVVKQRGEAQKTQDAIDAMNGSWEHGARQAMQEYVDSARNTAALTKNLFTNAFSGMEDALVSFVRTGKLDFKSLADSIIADMIRIEVKQQVILPLMQAMGFSGGSGASGSFLSGIGSSIAGFLGFRDGAAFDGGGVHAFASGGVVGSPTMFRFASGVGLMGEAGPEAIMPLKRGADGKLGVAGGGNVTVRMNMPVRIDARGADSSVLPALQAQLHAMEQRIYGNVPGIIRKAMIRNRVTPTV